METKKEIYFALVDTKKSLQERLEELANEWNETICWYGTPEEQKAHENLERSVRDEIKRIEEALTVAREKLDKQTLKSWADEYYGRK